MENKKNGFSLSGVDKKTLLGIVLSLVAFIVIGFCYFYPADVNGDVMHQSDVISGAANGQEIHLYQEKTGQLSRWTDALFGGMPTFQIAPSYPSGKLLGIIGSIYSLRIFGAPEYVSWVWMLLVGFFILMLAFKVKWYYAVLGAVGYAFSSYFFIIMGAGHIWKLLVLCYVPPTIAGVVLAYRGKYLAGGAVTALFGALQLQSNHVQMTYYFGFVILALVIGYLVAAICEKKMGQWLAATGTLAVAAVLLVAANAPSLYLTYKYSKETMRGGHSELTTDAQGKPVKASSKGGLDRDYITNWSYGKGETFTLLVPNVNGGASMKPAKNPNDPSQIVNQGVTLDQTSKAEDMNMKGELDQMDQQCLPFFTQYFGDQPGTNGPVYVGALICALFLLGCILVKGPVKWALVAVTLLSILLSWGHNFWGLTNFFIDYIPLYNKFRTPSSILVIAEFTMPLLGALGVYKLLADDKLSRGLKQNALYVSFGICGLLCLIFAIMPSLFQNWTQSDQATMDQITAQLGGQEPATLRGTIDTIRLSLVSSDAWRSLAFLAVGFALLFAWFKGWLKTNPMVVTLIVAAVVLVDLYTVDKRYINQDTFVSKLDIKPATFEKTPADEAILRDTAQNYRVLDVQNFMGPNASYYHKTVGGYHPAKLTRYNDLIERQLTKNNQLNIPQTPTGQLDWAKMGVWNMLNTKYIIADPTKQPIVNPSALGNAWFVSTLTLVPNADEEMKFLDNFDARTQAVADKKFAQVLGTAQAPSAGDTIFETTYAPNRLTYHSHSAKGCLAVFSEVYFPWGWTATIDGKEAQIGRVNYVLRALQVPAGDHSITFTFEPKEVSTTDGIARGAIIAIFLVCIAAVGLSMRRKKEQPAE